MKTLLILIPLILVSCRTPQLLPSSYDDTATTFSSYEDAIKSYEKIENYNTMTDDLKNLGFDIDKGQNVEVLTYLDVSKLFMHNQAIKKSDLPVGVLECLKVKDGCKAYRFKIESVKKERYGNFFADAFDFRKRTHHTGWVFECIIIASNGVVVYSLQSGMPNIDKRTIDKQPLGPLQNFGFSDVSKVL